MEPHEEPQPNRTEESNNNSVAIMSDQQHSSIEKTPVILSPSIYSNYTKKNLKAMESIHAKDAERATCMQFCRDTITALADRHHLQRAHIETLLSDRVRLKIVLIKDKLNFVKFSIYFFYFPDK